ncbi:MAG TPA: feruloyl-CoA synthase [Gemmatimonadaceae bacterium]|nr:feruloyl-CoA synthase [Gemmatimonadaceae bacterium]
MDRGADGVVYVRSAHALGPYAPKLTERLEHWAAHAPDRTFLAERDGKGAWRRLTYAEALARVRRIAQGLLDRGLSPERPIAILSGNGIEHALLALAAMYVGIPYAPIAPAYSLIAREYGTLRYLVESLRPSLVFAADGKAFANALRAVVHDTEVVVCEPVIPSPASADPSTSLGMTTPVIPSERSESRDLHLSNAASADPSTALGMTVTQFGELEARSPTKAVDAAHAAVGPDTIAKVLFTSGSTGRPKGVITTQRMLCANQEMLRSVMVFLAEEPPVLCDWLPWNHVFGGSHNFGIVLYNGGTMYIDEGKPTAAFGDTVRNLRDVESTAYFNVPRGYEMLVPHLRADAELRERFFRRVEILFYAAAGLGQRFWDELQEIAVEACGERVRMVTGLGATESAPFALCIASDDARAGMVGLPVPGVELKLAPVGEKLEARLRGPSITPGFWRDPERTRAAYDQEGYYRLGDALVWVDPADPSKGLAFDGRLDEDFKLSTGTWVSVGPLRARLLAALAPYAQDVVIAGHDRDEVTAMIFPNRARCDALNGDVLRAILAGCLGEVCAAATGSSTRVARALMLEEPPSIDASEVTDKGSINQRAVLRRRAALVEELYAMPTPAQVIIAHEGQHHD